MPVYDTPINTDTDALPRILGAGLPVLLYLHKSSSDALDTALREAAEDFAGAALIVRVNVAENPDVHQQYGSLDLPALLTLDEGEIESQAAHITAQDVDDHIMFLMGQGPLPQQTAAERAAKEASGAAPIHTADERFQQDVLESDIPVLVDFWAPWCGPCHMVAPVLEELARDYAGRVKIAKVNVDENQFTAQTYRTMSIPTLLLFKNGQKVGQLVGAHPRPSIEQLIQQAL